MLFLFTISVTELLMCHGHHVIEDQASTGTDSAKYAIIFDVSSSRTKMEIYKIDVDSPPLDVSDVHELDPSPSKAKPGIASPCHHKGFKEEITINGQKITFVGTASVPSCRSIIQKTFFCKTQDCPFRDQPSLHGDFFGFSGIFYAARDTGMLCSDCTKPLSAAMFDESSKNFCAKKYADVSSNPYAKNVCFESNYVYELLVKGYGLAVDKTILVGKELEGFSLGWTLGAMLYNSDLL